MARWGMDLFVALRHLSKPGKPSFSAHYCTVQRVDAGFLQGGRAHGLSIHFKLRPNTYVLHCILVVLITIRILGLKVVCHLGQTQLIKGRSAKTLPGQAEKRLGLILCLCCILYVQTYVLLSTNIIYLPSNNPSIQKVYKYNTHKNIAWGFK